MNTELISISCPQCDGEGGDVYAVDPGYPAPYSGVALPAERVAPCKQCLGLGELEVCTHCLEPFEVLHGVEVCRCTVAEVRRAA